MTDYLEIGSTPAEEECEQLGPGYRPDVARAECRLYIRAIKQVCGEPPEGARFIIRSNPHDSGTYHEVAVKFDENNEEARNYAFKCESDAPGEWPENLKGEAAALREGAAERRVSRY
jgi:hypothetical protein